MGFDGASTWRGWGGDLGVGCDIYVLIWVLFGGETPAVDVMVALLPPAAVGSLLLQLLALVLCPTVLEPHLHLRRNRGTVSTVGRRGLKNNTISFTLYNFLACILDTRHVFTDFCLNMTHFSGFYNI